MTQLGKIQASKNFIFQNWFNLKVMNIILILLVSSQITIFAQSGKRLATTTSDNRAIMDEPTTPVRRGGISTAGPNPYVNISRPNECEFVIYAEMLSEYASRLSDTETKFALANAAMGKGYTDNNGVHYDFPLPRSYTLSYYKRCEICHEKSTPENKPSGQQEGNSESQQVETEPSQVVRNNPDPRIDDLAGTAHSYVDYNVGPGKENLKRNGDNVNKQIEQRGLGGQVHKSTPKRVSISSNRTDTDVKKAENVENKSIGTDDEKN